MIVLVSEFEIDNVSKRISNNDNEVHDRTRKLLLLVGLHEDLTSVIQSYNEILNTFKQRFPNKADKDYSDPKALLETIKDTFKTMLNNSNS